VLLLSQITIDDSVLPVVNDVHKTFIDDMPDVSIGRQGLDQNWNFSSLSSGLIYERNLLPPDPVLIFSPIDYDFFINEGARIIKMYKLVDKQLYEVAVQQPHPLNSNYITFSKYESPKLIAYAPLEYRAEKTNRSTIFYYMPGDQIPDLIQNKLPITADSLRLKVSEVCDFRVDATGSLSLPYDQYDVLRQEVYSRTVTSLEIFSAGKWSRINNDILDPTSEILGSRVERKYLFYSDIENMPLATVRMNSDGIISDIEVKAPEESNNYISANTDQEQLILSPNPTYGDVKLELVNLEPGTYQFKIFNIIGKKLWEEEVVIKRKITSSKYNFGFLGKGTYLWAITDDQGVRLTTKRLIVVTP